jgi:ATP-binding protein involved in chromosome partitioning
MVGVPGVGDVRIAMSAEKVQRTIIAVGSGKGGVGKSTLSANLAVALARTGRKVGLVDADIYGPSQPRIMGNNQRPELIDKLIVPVEAHGIRMLSLGQLVEEGSALAWRGPMAASALGQLIDADWGDTEMLVVDLPPGTGDIQLSLIQKWKPKGAVIVSTPQDLALIDATRAIDLFRKMDVPILGLVENMSGYICPHCGEESDPFGAGGAEAAARVMSIPFLGRVPLTLSIRRMSDAGTPPAAGDGDEAQPFLQIAERLAQQLNPKRQMAF